MALKQRADGHLDLMTEILQIITCPPYFGADERGKRKGHVDSQIKIVNQYFLGLIRNGWQVIGGPSELSCIHMSFHH